MSSHTEIEERLDELVDEKLDERGLPSADSGVSRRTTLGLAGLVGLGGLVGTGTARASGVSDHSLEDPLLCNEEPIRGIDNIEASHPFPSIKTNGEGNGNLQLYDADEGVFFLRASEAPEESGPGPVMFNTEIRGVPEDAAGDDAIPGPLTIADDVTVDGNDVQDVGAIEGTLTDGERLESLAGSNLTIADGQLDVADPGVDEDIEARLDDAVTRLEVVSGAAKEWRVGPDAPVGSYHFAGSFGTLFEIERPTYLGECTIDAKAAGQFTPALFEYDRSADALGEKIDTITVQATGDPQTIFLDFLVDEPGTYLLTRLVPSRAYGHDLPDTLVEPSDDPIELRRRANYGAESFADDSRDGAELLGGYNPYEPSDPYDVNEHYYYYFDLEVSSAESA